MLQDKIPDSVRSQLPVFVRGDRIEGQTDLNAVVEGNAELTPARLVGHFDPAMVLERGYDPAVFVDGPLLTAMRGAGQSASAGGRWTRRRGPNI